MKTEGLDTYATSWKETHRANCEATSARGEQSVAVTDLRMRCLDRAKISLDTAIALLEESDPEILRRTPELLAGLPAVKDCADVEELARESEAVPTEAAVRVEITFASDVTVGGGRVPRAQSDAIAEYLRSLPPPPPIEPGDSPQVLRGAEVFEEQSCDGCHTPPLHASDRRVTVDEIGTDPAAGLGSSRATGYDRVPSLRGVGRTAPYLHHGAVDTLDAMFDPSRTEPGHTFGRLLSDADRAALIRFLRSI